MLRRRLVDVWCQSSRSKVHETAAIIKTATSVANAIKFLDFIKIAFVNCRDYDTGSCRGSIDQSTIALSIIKARRTTCESLWRWNDTFRKWTESIASRSRRYRSIGTSIDRTVSKTGSYVLFGTRFLWKLASKGKRATDISKEINRFDKIPIEMKVLGRKRAGPSTGTRALRFCKVCLAEMLVFALVKIESGKGRWYLLECAAKVGKLELFIAWFGWREWRAHLSVQQCWTFCTLRRKAHCRHLSRLALCFCRGSLSGFGVETGAEGTKVRQRLGNDGIWERRFGWLERVKEHTNSSVNRKRETFDDDAMTWE